MERGAEWAQSMGLQRVGQDLVTEQQKQSVLSEGGFTCTLTHTTLYIAHSENLFINIVCAKKTHS